MTMEPETPSPEFVRLVRTALAHFYDYAYLQKHPLAFLLAAGSNLDRVTRAQKVRRTLLEGIEALKPDAQGGGDRAIGAARAYAVLTCRYVDGMTVERATEELALSRRQLYREHEKGVDAVASLLWDRVRKAGQNGLPLASSDQESAIKRLEMARSEVERLRQAERTEPLDLKEILEQVLDLLKPLARQAEAQISLATQGTWPLVVADRMMLRQAFANLLSFALSETQGDLLLTTSVGDSGIVMDISESSARASESPPSARKRTGVSITIAKELIEAQGGHLEISSQDGRWRAQAVLPTAGVLSVLVIDDNPSIIALLQRYLAGHGISVIGEADGRRALGLASELQPRAIILDVMMPHQDGWEILKSIKSISSIKEIPVIVCSVLNEPELALSMGATDYLTKPVGQAELLDVLRRQLGLLQTAT